MPVQERLGPHEEGVPGTARQHPAERRQEQPMMGLDRGPTYLAAKKRQLVAEHEDLELLGSITAAEKNDQLEQAADDDVHG
jgi:hypothetical protein